MSTNYRLEKIKDRIKGSVYGFAIGDAMGATTEFMDSEIVALKYGKITEIIGGGWLNLKAGEVTDDTQMTLCVADAIRKSNCNTFMFNKLLKENFIKWFDGNPPDVGCICAKSIFLLKQRGILPKRTDEKSDISERPLGNGSLMRALPCALLDKMELNLMQGSLTHNDVYCDNIIKLYHENIVRIVYANDFIRYNVKKMQPTGEAFNTLNNALYWSNKDSFEECIVGAVNDGGDADTIAAISGSLSGARFGYSYIPTRWIKSLDLEVRYQLDLFIDYVIKYNIINNII